MENTGSTQANVCRRQVSRATVPDLFHRTSPAPLSYDLELYIHRSDHGISFELFEDDRQCAAAIMVRKMSQCSSSHGQSRILTRLQLQCRTAW